MFIFPGKDIQMLIVFYLSQNYFRLSRQKKLKKIETFFAFLYKITNNIKYRGLFSKIMCL